MKKKLSFFFCLFSIFVFAQNKIRFSAQIINRNSDSLTIYIGNSLRVIYSDANGNFRDNELSAPPGVYQMFDGAEWAELYLKNGFDLRMRIDARMFDETISFEGSGAKENNYLAQKLLAFEKMEKTCAGASGNDVVEKAVDRVIKKLETDLQDPAFDPHFAALEKAGLAREKPIIKFKTEERISLGRLKGKASPAFSFENFKGGTTSLKDLKGSYVYIDVWATSCAPCRAQIPHLVKLEHDYQDKNIKFVSISVDERKNYSAWRKVIEDNQMAGLQLIASKGWNSNFIKAYYIKSIPRFILIDPQGNVVNADAPKPSDPNVRREFDKLLR